MIEDDGFLDPDDELEEWDCGHDHDYDDFFIIAEHPGNQLIDPGQAEVEARMALGDVRYESIRDYQDDVAMAQLRAQQATAQFIFAQSQVHSAYAGAIRAATIAVLASTPFLVLRLFRR